MKICSYKVTKLCHLFLSSDKRIFVETNIRLQFFLFLNLEKKTKNKFCKVATLICNMERLQIYFDIHDTYRVKVRHKTPRGDSTH